MSSSTAPGSTAAVLLLNIPPSMLCGIDLVSFTTNQNFKGFKHVPPGFHFVYVSETTSMSIRDCCWFQIPQNISDEPPLLAFEWNASIGTLQAVSTIPIHRNQSLILWERNLSPFRASAPAENGGIASEIDWMALTAYVSSDLLAHLTQCGDWKISSASCMPEDREDIPGLTQEETGIEERELGSLGIDLKHTWREGAVGRERTDGATDRSWALEHVIDTSQQWYATGSGQWGSAILGQMQACFLMMLTVANYSCMEEWKRCLELVLTSKRVVSARQDWFGKFLSLLKVQTERWDDVEGGLFDLSDEGGGLLRRWLKTFKRTLSQELRSEDSVDLKSKMEELEDLLRGKYGWELSDDFVRRGNVQLEDGETIEVEVSDMHGEDEDGEYAPVIVDLDDSTDK